MKEGKFQVGRGPQDPLPGPRKSIKNVPRQGRLHSGVIVRNKLDAYLYLLSLYLGLGSLTPNPALLHITIYFTFYLKKYK